MAVIVYCRRQGCGVGYGSTGELPVVCPACHQPTRWSTSPPEAGERIALSLTDADRRFLRSYKIDPD